MSRDEAAGVAFSASEGGRQEHLSAGPGRGRRCPGPGGPGRRAVDARRETNGARGLARAFPQADRSGADIGAAAVSVAGDRLASLHRQMRAVAVRLKDGAGYLLRRLRGARADRGPGVSARGGVKPELSLPYRGERLYGSALQRRLDTWVSEGVIEPSCADAVRPWPRTPTGWPCPARRSSCSGRAPKWGRCRCCSSWGARVIGVDLPRPVIWERVLANGAARRGTLLVPVARDKPGEDAEGGVDLARRAGLDLTEDIPQWPTGWPR